MHPKKLGHVMRYREETPAGVCLPGREKKQKRKREELRAEHGVVFMYSILVGR